MWSTYFLLYHVFLVFTVVIGFSPLFGADKRGRPSFSPDGLDNNNVILDKNESPNEKPWFPLTMAKSNDIEIVADSTNDAHLRAKQQQRRQPQRTQNVKFAAPLLDYGYPDAVEDLRDQTENADSSKQKPILLYLPGFDGTYICPFIQFPELGTEFEVWCMTIAMNDRSTFEELKQNVLDFIDEIGEPSPPDGNPQDKKSNTKSNSSWFKFGPSESTKRPIYLAGESFGGILASEVALTILKERRDANLKGLTLINPATCYDRSQLASMGPPVSKLPALLYIPGLLRLLPLFADEYSFEQLLLILTAKALPSVIDNPARESYMGRVAFSLPTKLEFMPPSTLEWRLNEWLETGRARMQTKMAEFSNFPKLPTLVIAGERDLTLPSIAEAERLANVFPKCQIHVVEGAGHASTCGSRMDMAALLRNRFPELLKKKKNNNSNNKNGKNNDNGDKKNSTDNAKRISMKDVASQGKGATFGMEPRYDGADIGLNPLLYWSNENYRSVVANEETRIFQQDDGSQRVYKRTSYSVV